MTNPATCDSNLQVSVSVTQTLLQALRQYDHINLNALLAEAGIDPEQLSQPENRIPYAQQARLWQLAVTASKDESFPLTFAQQSQPASFSVAGYIAMNSRTVGEAMDASQLYQRAAGEGGALSIARDADNIYVNYLPVDPGLNSTPPRSCAMLAANLILGRWLVGETYTPIAVELSMSEPDRPDIFVDFFRCSVQFSCPKDQLTFRRELEHIPIPHASLELLALMKQRADKVIAQATPKQTLAAQVAALLVQSLLGQEPDKATIAENLGMSPRTLQRKLAKESTSYQEVLDQTRHKLALDYLEQPQLNITDIAYLLGFTEPSAFYRAFKKWHGLPPGQYREKHIHR